MFHLELWDVVRISCRNCQRPLFAEVVQIFPHGVGGCLPFCPSACLPRPFRSSPLPRRCGWLSFCITCHQYLLQKSFTPFCPAGGFRLSIAVSFLVLLYHPATSRPGLGCYYGTYFELQKWGNHINAIYTHYDNLV